MAKQSVKLTALQNNETLFLDLGNRWVQAYAVEGVEDENGEQVYRIEAGNSYMPADWNLDGTFDEIVAEVRKTKDLRSWKYRTW